MTDPTEDICDAIVTYVNDLSSQEDSPLSLKVAASKPEDVEALLKGEIDGLQVYLVPFSEEEERIGRGGQVLERFTVTMLVVRKLASDYRRERLMRLVRELRDELRGVAMAGNVYSNSEIATKFDPERLHEANQFMSAMRLTYLGTN